MKAKLFIFSISNIKLIISPKGQVSYCHYLASVIVARRKLFQKCSPLKVLDQWKPNWSESSLGCLVSKLCPVMPCTNQLKIEHMVKLQVLGNNSKTVNNIKNQTWGNNDQHSKIYLPCNFEVNLSTHLRVSTSNL